MSSAVYVRNSALVFLNGEPVEISDAVLTEISARADEAHRDHTQRLTTATTADIVMAYADTSASGLAPMKPEPRPLNRDERRARRFGR